MRQNTFATAAPPRTALRPPSWIWGEGVGKGGEGKEEEKEGRRRGGKGRGWVNPLRTKILATATALVSVGLCLK